MVPTQLAERSVDGGGHNGVGGGYGGGCGAEVVCKGGEVMVTVVVKHNGGGGGYDSGGGAETVSRGGAVVRGEQNSN